MRVQASEGWPHGPGAPVMRGRRRGGGRARALPDEWSLSDDDKRSFGQTNVPWSEHEQFLDRLRTVGVHEDTLDDIRSGIGGSSPWPSEAIERKGAEISAKLDAHAARASARRKPKRLEEEDNHG